MGRAPALPVLHTAFAACAASNTQAAARVGASIWAHLSRPSFLPHLVHAHTNHPLLPPTLNHALACLVRARRRTEAQKLAHAILGVEMSGRGGWERGWDHKPAQPPPIAVSEGVLRELVVCSGSTGGVGAALWALRAAGFAVGTVEADHVVSVLVREERGYRECLLVLMKVLADKLIPTTYLFNVLLAQCPLSHVLRLCAVMDSVGTPPDQVTLNTLARRVCEWGGHEVGVALVVALAARGCANHVTFLSVLAACAAAGDCTGAGMVLKAMVHAHPARDTALSPRVFQAVMRCANTANRPHTVHAVHHLYLLRWPTEHAPDIRALMLGVHGVAGDVGACVSTVLRPYRQGHGAGALSPTELTALLSACVRSHCPRLAMVLFATLVSGTDSCARVLDRAGEWRHELVGREQGNASGGGEGGDNANSTDGMEVLVAWAIEGRHISRTALTLPVQNTLLTACVTAGEWELACSEYERMVRHGPKPNVASLNLALRALGKAGRVEDMVRLAARELPLFEQGAARTHCPGSADTYTLNALVEGCVNARQVGLALFLVQSASGVLASPYHTPAASPAATGDPSYEDACTRVVQGMARVAPNHVTFELLLRNAQSEQQARTVARAIGGAGQQRLWQAAFAKRGWKMLRSL